MEIKQAVAELLEVLKQGIVGGKELITTQFPILCQQIVRWGIWSNIYQIVVCLVLLYIDCRLIPLALKKLSIDDYDIGGMLLMAGCIITIIFAGIFLLFSLFNLIKVLSTPNLYILEYLKEMIK
jgi:hypothetical protein